MEIFVLAVQARVLLWVGLGWLALGLWLGFDPATVAWRAALGALAAMWITGKLLRIAVQVINDRAIADLAERELAAEAAAEAAAGGPAKPSAVKGAAKGAAARPRPPSPARAAIPG